jgi:long-chain acyl-CoA synthetase
MLVGRSAARFAGWGERPALVDEEEALVSYAELARRIGEWRKRLPALGVRAGDVVGLKGPYSAELIACFWALALEATTVLPLSEHAPELSAPTRKSTELAHLLRVDARGAWTHEPLAAARANPLLGELRSRAGSGLILFSSGTEGEPKIVLHDLERLFGKYDRNLKSFRTLLFLVFDHIAGLDTLFYTLCAGGCAVIENTRRPEAVCRAIARSKVQVLAATPSFLALLLASGAHLEHDLASLEIVTYGSEPMPPPLLRRLAQALPATRFIQKYGTTELGSPASRSRANDAVWMKIDGERFESRVVDHILWIRAQGAMLGYLNRPTPFDQGGWLNTGDLVEVDGEWMRILGRASEIINVGGNKVLPASVESALLQIPNVAAVSVWGEPNPLLGQVVAVRITPKAACTLEEMKSAVRAAARAGLAPHEAPVRIELSALPDVSYRWKRARHDR